MTAVNTVKHKMSLVVRKPVFGVSDQVDTNRAVLSHKRWLEEVEISDNCAIRIAINKGADQLRGYREADLRICFLMMRLK